MFGLSEIKKLIVVEFFSKIESEYTKIFPFEWCKEINRFETLFLRYNGLILACCLPKLCIFIAKAVYLDAISMTKYEIFFKLLYDYKCYILVCRIV